MRVLILTPQIPYPPQQGTAIRNFHLIAGVARTHAVTLLSFQEPGQPDPQSGPLAALCRRIETVPDPPRRPAVQRLSDLLSGQADLARRLVTEAFNVRLRGLLASDEFDLVQVEGLEMAPYIRTIRAALRRPAMIYDGHNAEYVLQERAYRLDRQSPGRWVAAVYSRIQARRLRRYEAHVCALVDRVLVVSGEDRAALRRLQPELDPVVIPNGIDISEYAAPWTGRSEAGLAQPGQAPWSVVFTGKMDFRPNVDGVLWFARHIWPRIRAAIPTARLAVVGKNPHQALNVLRGQPDIEIVGQVSDVRPYISGALVYIAPLRMGGGTRFKLLEAMAMGKPVVSTGVGAEGFEVTSGQELLLADTPQAFAGETIALLRDPAYRERLGRAARSFIESRYDWRLILPRVEEVYAEMGRLRRRG